MYFFSFFIESNKRWNYDCGWVYEFAIVCPACLEWDLYYIFCHIEWWDEMYVLFIQPICIMCIFKFSLLNYAHNEWGIPFLLVYAYLGHVKNLIWWKDTLYIMVNGFSIAHSYSCRQLSFWKHDLLIHSSRRKFIWLKPDIYASFFFF